MSVLRVAVVGCGAIATGKYIPIFKRLKRRARIVGLCDVNAEAVRNASISASVESADGYVSLSDMLRRQRPDLAIICTPPRTHAESAIKAMEHGAHVLVEKPMATSLADCDRMIEASTAHNRRLGVMHNQLFNPAVDEAKRVVSNDAFGRFLGMRVLLATNVNYMTSVPNHWAHGLPGGVCGETAPHAVYLSLAFLNNVRDVQVRYKKLLPEYPWSIGEDFRIDLVADNGISSIALWYGSIQTAAEIDILGTVGLVRLDLQSRSLVEFRRPDLRAGTVCKSVFSSACQMTRSLALNGIRLMLSRELDSHYRGVVRFLDHLLSGTEYPATGEEGRRTIAVTETIVERMRDLAAITSA